MAWTARRFRKAALLLDISPPSLSRREAAKSGRRIRIVEAARDILREAGVDGLSVKAAAARANVSLSTLYNLFASKDAILASIYDLHLQHCATLVEQAHAPSYLERIFVAIEIAADLYRADQNFYRAILRRDTGATSDPARDAWLQQPRKFWLDLLNGAVQEGSLRPSADTAVLNVLLQQVLSGVTADWVMGRIGEERFAAEAKLACASVLAAFSRGEAGLRLRKIIASHHRQLSAEPRASGLRSAA